MALALNDRVQQTGTANTTVSFTLSGSVTGFQSFAVIGNGNITYYSATDTTGGWEVGIGTYSTTGPTLTRTTILSSSNSNTAVTFSGQVTVWVTYPSEKSVNLDGTGNVSALGTVTSGTWNGSTVGVAYGGTGVTSSSGANSVVLRDSNANVVFNNFTSSAAVTVAAAGTTVLTVASARTQILSGSTTQTYQLPDATTLALGQSFLFINLSSGILTVKDNASTTVDTIPSGGITQLGALSIATSAGSWGAYSFLPGSYDFNTSTASFGSANLTNGTWQGSTIGTAYGGTGLTSYTSGGAVYATSTSALTSGTLPVTAGGTGQTTFSSGYIPYGNSTAALQSSNLLQFNGTYMQVGGGSVLGGTTNPIAAFTQSANNYIQTYTYNTNSGTSASADFVAYTDNSTDAHGWADIGYTSSTYNDASYSVTGPNEAYVLGSAPSGVGATGNLVYATDSTGSANAHQWYVGGFNQAKGSWKMQLTSTGLQLASALGAAYGGTGLTAPGTSGNVLTSNGTAWTSSAPAAATLAITNDTTTATALYPTFTNATSGSISGLSVTSTKLNFTPTTGALTAPEIVASNGMLVHSKTVSTSYAIPSGSNAIAAGPVTVASGAAVTIPSGSRWLIL